MDPALEPGASQLHLSDVLTFCLGLGEQVLELVRNSLPCYVFFRKCEPLCVLECFLSVPGPLVSHSQVCRSHSHPAGYIPMVTPSAVLQL